MKPRHYHLALLFVLACASTASAQPIAELTRANPKFLQSFRPVIARPGASTVRVQCDGKDTALGLVVAADGWVLTKANDLRGKVSCRLRDGRSLEAKIVGVHKVHDLALLKIDADGLTPAELKDSKQTVVGSWVAWVGTGEDPVAVGVVSVPTRDVRSRGPGADAIARAGYLGISMETSDRGVRITRIFPSTAAAKAGLLEGDIVLSISGTAVSDMEQFIEQMLRYRPGDAITLRVRRDDEELELKATLQQRPAGSNRTEMQNRMGSELSSRRSGYPTILQHDSVVKPADCGGPLVDLDGKVIGINICRAGRTESWAVPTEVIRAVLPGLKAGASASQGASVAPDAGSRSSSPRESERAARQRPEATNGRSRD
jgi:serine protease Do